MILGRRGFFGALCGGMAIDLEPVKSAEILRLTKDDILVLKCKGYPKAEDMERIRAIIESQFPGQKCLVTGPDIDVSVIKS